MRNVVTKRKTLLLILWVGSASLAQAESTNRPADWAEPMEMAGVPNLNKGDENLYRSAQPSEQGMRNLKKMGIETIVNLRSFSSDRDEIGDTGLGWNKGNAIREMSEGGHGYNKVWRNLPKWIRELDIEAVKRRAGI